MTQSIKNCAPWSVPTELKSDSDIPPSTSGNIMVSDGTTWTSVPNPALLLNQSTPQTLINGIPLLEATRDITTDNQIIDKKYADTVQSGGMKSFFFTKTASDVAGMYKASTVYAPTGLQTITATAVEGETIIASFITDVALSPYRVLDGSRLFYFTSKVSSVVKPTQLKAYIYTTDALGANPVLLRTSTVSKLMTEVDSTYILTSWGESLNIDITTRIKFVIAVIKSGGGLNPTITLSVEDDTFSRLDVPSPTGVTDITGLVPYTGATANVNLGVHTLATAQVLTPSIKTDTSAPTDLTITTGADKTLLLGTVVYDDIIIQATNLRGSGTTPPTFDVFQNSIYATKFTNGQTDIVYGSFEIPHTYKEGTDLEVHLHWSPSSTNTGNCVFNFAYTIASMGGTFGNEANITMTQAGSGTINKHQYVSGNILLSGVGIGIGTIVVFALSRPTGDAFSGDAWLHSIGVHYQLDTMGSRLISSK